MNEQERGRDIMMTNLKTDPLRAITTPPNKILDFLYEKSKDKEFPYFYNKNKECLIIRLIPLYYIKQKSRLPINENINLSYMRDVAIKELFYRYCKAGMNKNCAKNPYRSQAFMKYLDEKYNFNECDYLILTNFK